MVWHTLSAFAAVQRIARTLVVVAPGDGFFERNPTTSALVVACGGATRAASVANGLRELRRAGAVDNDWVLVHDAARCLITPDLINRLIDTCANDEVGGLLALATCVLLSRVVTAAAARVLSSRRGRDAVAVLGFLLLIGLAPASSIGGSFELTLEDLAGVTRAVGWSPLGWAWAAPADFAQGQPLTGLLRLALAVVAKWGLVVALGVLAIGVLKLPALPFLAGLVVAILAGAAMAVRRQ